MCFLTVTREQVLIPAERIRAHDSFHTSDGFFRCVCDSEEGKIRGDCFDASVVVLSRGRLWLGASTRVVLD